MAARAVKSLVFGRQVSVSCSYAYMQVYSFLRQTSRQDGDGVLAHGHGIAFLPRLGMPLLETGAATPRTSDPLVSPHPATPRDTDREEVVRCRGAVGCSLRVGRRACREPGGPHLRPTPGAPGGIPAGRGNGPG